MSNLSWLAIGIVIGVVIEWRATIELERWDEWLKQQEKN